MKKVSFGLALGLGCLIMLGIAYYTGLWSTFPARASTEEAGREPRQVFEASNPYVTDSPGRDLRIRVEMYPDERPGLVLGAEYVFSARTTANNWQEIMRNSHHDPNPIPCDQVRFINERVAYIFMGRRYAVTTDAGANWRAWDMTTDFAEWPTKKGTIRNVEVAVDGTGTMEILLVGNPQKLRTLRTTDYGFHWQ